MRRVAAAGGLSALGAVALSLAVLAVFRQVGGHDFIGLDDGRYITENPWVRGGLSRQGVLWAWRGTPPYWHPLTWLSHMLDVSLFGQRPGWHHLENLFLHLANALLLLFLLRRITGNQVRSIFAAALFALHPLRVESVAWVAERKDLLSALFCLLALHAYAAHLARPSWRRAGAVTVLFVLALLAKPMVVTLPVILLLLDGWPFGRLRAAANGDGRRPLLARALEKVPLLVLSAGVAFATYSLGKANIHEAHLYPLGIRLATGVVATADYLGQTLWPSALAIFYPHPASLGGTFPAWRVALALLIVAGLSSCAILVRRRSPAVAAGWLWYLVTLLPVAGFVQTWEQSRADRFTYLPHIGLFLALVWGIGDLAARLPGARKVIAPAAVATLVALGVCSHRQTAYWKNTQTLFARALAVTEKNWLAHSVLGSDLAGSGDLRGAMTELRSAISLRPVFPKAHYNLGVVLEQLGRSGEAAEEYRLAIEQDSTSANAYTNYGVLLAAAGRTEEAMTQYRRALELNPRDVYARNNLAMKLAAQGRVPEAIQQLTEALKIDPGYKQAAANLKRLQGRGASSARSPASAR